MKLNIKGILQFSVLAIGVVVMSQFYQKTCYAQLAKKNEGQTLKFDSHSEFVTWVADQDFMTPSKNIMKVVVEKGQITVTIKPIENSKFEVNELSGDGDGPLP